MKTQHILGLKELRENMLDKNKFLKKYKTIYKKIFNKIMKSAKNGSKQK